MQRVRGREAGRRLTGQHLLLLPDGTWDAAVGGLVFAHHPEAATHPGEGLRLGRHAVLHGPLHLDAGAAAAAGVPAPWLLAWALECPPERGEPPLPGVGDRDGLSRAFPDGLPVRAERRAVDLLLGLARRLDGAVRVAGSGVVLVPDPHAWSDVVVHSSRWLGPAAAHRLLAPVCPALRAATAGASWHGVREEAMDHLAALPTELTPAEREGLHAAADRRDTAAAAALAAAGAPTAHALVADLGEGGVVEVLVGEVEEVPALLARLGARIAYQVRWWPADEAAAEHEHPAAPHLAQRRAARALIAGLVAALVPAVGGTAVDAAGFPLPAGRLPAG